jgi:hypothetical protein
MVRDHERTWTDVDGLDDRIRPRVDARERRVPQVRNPEVAPDDAGVAGGAADRNRGGAPVCARVDPRDGVGAAVCDPERVLRGSMRTTVEPLMRPTQTARRVIASPPAPPVTLIVFTRLRLGSMRCTVPNWDVAQTAPWPANTSKTRRTRKRRTTRFVRGSIRMTLSPAKFPTQTAPAAAVIPQGCAPTLIRATTVLLAGSILTTSPVPKRLAHADPAANATEQGRESGPVATRARSSVASGPAAVELGRASARARARRLSTPVGMRGGYYGSGVHATEPEHFPGRGLGAPVSARPREQPALRGFSPLRSEAGLGFVAPSRRSSRSERS